MNVLGLVGVGSPARERTVEARHAAVRRAKSSRGALDLFLDYSPEEGRVPINHFPLRGLGHDCAAALLADGRLVAAVAEERFNRRKHSVSIDGRNLLPRQAARFCLDAAGTDWKNLDAVCHYLDFTPEVMARRQAILDAFLPPEMRSAVSTANWRSFEEEFCHDQIARQIGEVAGFDLPRDRLHFVPHHVAHAAAAYYSSGFEQAGIVTLDGYGEKDSSVVAIGDDLRLAVQESIEIPHSLGILYMVVTVFLGFRALNDEYKVMGLAALGDPAPFRRAMGELMTTDSQGHYRTDILANHDLVAALVELFGPPREPDTALTKREMDIAAALQERLEEVVLTYLRAVKARHGFERLCMSGGVALNSVLNGRIAREGLFKEIHVFPAASDDGCAVGAAQYGFHHVLGQTGRQPVTNVYLGPDYRVDSIEAVLRTYADRIDWRRSDDPAEEAALLIAAQNVIGWFQGRTEFGPRALGNRSILGDARNPAMKDIINNKVKWREPFRPFAPAVKLDTAHEYFDMAGVGHSPFMLFVAPVHTEARSRIPAITHNDGTARVQTVTKQENELFWRLLDCFEQRTGMGLVLNTSFNVKGEPIVNSPEDAIQCFLRTNIDALVIGNFIVCKKDQTDGND